MGKSLSVNLSRLKSTFEMSNKIGGTKNGGIHRLTFTEEDKQMRDIFVQWMKDSGLKVRVDDFGNIYGKREGKNKNADSVMIGSHLDSMPMAGRYDGILGVLASLEVVRTLNDHNIETERSIEIVNFTNEEGERFKPNMLGSGGITGKHDKEFIYNVKDYEGITFLEGLKEIDYLGSKNNRASHVAYFIELHIEQGPFLEANKKVIGVVDGVKGSSRFKLSIKGVSSHGAFPNDFRNDALIAASEIALVIDNQPDIFQDNLTTSIGVFEVYPSVQSQTSENVEMTFDVRHLNGNIKRKAINNIKQSIEEIANKKGVEVKLEQTWDANGQNFSKKVIEMVKDGAESYQYPYQYITSSPLHDASYIADIAETGMIFVPCEKGLSHREEEYVSFEDIEKGVNVLLYATQKLANL
ncbi:M20 family metallo-hydrolase [Virgibacillus necropolis]|uniref:Zn-dependent hydrolase n=1 Tax=Virgibacillus necropolis TaxID=163877 RepID=A0A221MCL5_9BACI|nr:M20 family metallo-hydrolase [Virgibacillus necropolis]ASN05362.1 Zn-dependent hydrolase [Virgibacillus necropolis]